MNTELYMEGYKVDLLSDQSALLTFSIDNIKKFAQRSTTWSKTIVVPGTANNNRLFGHIFQVGQSNGFNQDAPNVGYNFNAAQSANVVLFQDQIQAFKGVLRLLEVVYYGGLQGRVEYEVSIFGNISGLNSDLTAGKLEDLDFSDYDSVYNINNIVGSWDSAPGTGLHYPLIDYGNYSIDKHSWDYRTFRPAIYAKDYVDRMFSSAKYRYVCPLFDTDRFKRLIVPHNQKELRINQSIVASGNLGSAVTGFLFSDSNPENPNTILYNAAPLPNFNSSIFSPGVSGYSVGGQNYTKFTYTDTATVTLKITYSFSGRHYCEDTGFTFSVLKNDTYIPSSPIQASVPPSGGNSFVDWNITGEISLTFNTGDSFGFLFYHDINTQTNRPYEVDLLNASFNITTLTGSSLLVPVQLGQTIKVNDCIPKNVRQIDFLVGLVKLWNLYVYEDKNDPYLIYITPYIDFYSKNTSYAVDWTQKLNIEKPVKSRPMSELTAKIYKFKWKQDGDFYSDLYRKRYNEGYGDRIYDSQFEFSTQTDEFEIAFASTVLVGYNGEDKIYSTIFKRNGTEPNVTEENIDSAMRLLQTKTVTGVTPWDIKDGGTVLTTLTRYGYAGHIDDPDVPTNDLNFGAPRELFFVMTAGSITSNQFNVYWASYMREITDKDSKLITGSFYLTAKDILNLDFAKYVYLDGIAYRLNAIRDYNATIPGDCIVELFKVNSATTNEVIGNDGGPPEGCYLLWSDEQILLSDDDDELLHGPCDTNPGDGGNPDPEEITIQYSFSRGASLTLNGSLLIYEEDQLVISANANGQSGSFVITPGLVYKAQVKGSNRSTYKSLVVSNDSTGNMYNQAGSFVILEYEFIAQAGTNYTINGSI